MEIIALIISLQFCCLFDIYILGVIKFATPSTLKFSMEY